MSNFRVFLPAPAPEAVPQLNTKASNRAGGMAWLGEYLQRAEFIPSSYIKSRSQGTGRGSLSSLADSAGSKYSKRPRLKSVKWRTVEEGTNIPWLLRACTYSACAAVTHTSIDTYTQNCTTVSCAQHTMPLCLLTGYFVVKSLGDRKLCVTAGTPAASVPEHYGGCCCLVNRIVPSHTRGRTKFPTQLAFDLWDLLARETESLDPLYCLP